MRSADRIGVGIGMGIGQTRGLSLHADLAFVRLETYQRKIFGDYIKKSRPARVVTTDAGLNDYINDFFCSSLVVGRREGGGRLPLIPGLRRGLLLCRVSGCRRRQAFCHRRAFSGRKVSSGRRAFYLRRLFSSFRPRRVALSSCCESP